MTDNTPVPQPKKVKMPTMTEADKKRLGIPAGSPAPSAHGGGGSSAMMAPSMMGSSMCSPMMGGGYPGIGGMGPNLVFNFNQPYGYMMAAVAECGGDGGKDKDEKEEKEEEKPKPEYVQADPTWRNPRLVQAKGKPLKKEPCVIQ
ncbi:uncharacterized protein ATC70_006726 [Mucor velutinosus]|uniref:Uncharacterized protein n=1 Tax=Mucor velutinosus TaxID=708070 RepID=A0AAN7DT03_9FUNG|nr:hypothetical protein ATC70_006726 [Mucor velutinosus]